MTNAKRLVILFSGPRSGSNFLLDLLGRVPNALVLSEVFNPRSVYGLNLHPELEARLLAKAGSHAALHRAFRMAPAQSVADIMQAIDPGHTLFLKIQPNQVHGAAVREILAAHAQAAIVLKRRRLDQFVSLRKAQTAQAWFDKDTTDIRPEIALGGFLPWTGVLDAWLAQVSGYCRAMKTPTMVLDYEADLGTGDQSSIAQSLSSQLAQIGVPTPAEVLTGASFFTRQDRTADPFDKIANGSSLKVDFQRLGLLDYALGSQDIRMG